MTERNEDGEGRLEPVAVYFNGPIPTVEELARLAGDRNPPRLTPVPEGFELESGGKTCLVRVLSGEALEEVLFGLRAWCASAWIPEEHTLEEVLAATEGVTCAVLCADVWFGVDEGGGLHSIMSGLHESRRGLTLQGCMLLRGERDVLAAAFDDDDDDDLDFDDTTLGFQRPLPSKVARRALVSLAVSQRAHAEREPRGEAEEGMADLRAWLVRHGLTGELEPEERVLFDAPVGSLDEHLAFEAAWRVEAAAVLAWALERFDLPEPGEVDPDDLIAALGFDGDARVLVRPRFRPQQQLEEMATESMGACFEMIASAPADPTPEECRRATALRHRNAAFHWLLGVFETLGSLVPDAE